MLEVRFTQEKMNKIQVYLNEIGRFKMESSDEDLKIFIDRFKTLIAEVKSIDASQVPTDLNLMGVLKEAIRDKRQAAEVESIISRGQKNLVLALPVAASVTS